MEQNTLVKAAKELNVILGLKPEIDIKQDLKGLKEVLREAADLLEPEDSISGQTQKVIDQIMDEQEGLEPETEPETEPAKKEKKEKKEKKKSTGTSQKKTGSPVKITRLQTAGKVIRDGKGKNISDLIKTADALFVENGGDSNLKESRSAVNKAVQALVAFGAIKVEGNVIK